MKKEYVQQFQLKRAQRYHANQLADARHEASVMRQFGGKMPTWPQALWRASVLNAAGWRPA